MVAHPNSSLVKPNFPFTISAWFNASTLDGSIAHISFAIIDLSYSTDFYTGAWINIFNSHPSVAYGDNYGCTNDPCRKTETMTNQINIDQWYHIISIFHFENSMENYIDCELQKTNAGGTGDFNLFYSSNPGN